MNILAIVALLGFACSNQDGGLKMQSEELPLVVNQSDSSTKVEWGGGGSTESWLIVEKNINDQKLVDEFLSSIDGWEKGCLKDRIVQNENIFSKSHYVSWAKQRCDDLRSIIEMVKDSKLSEEPNIKKQICGLSEELEYLSAAEKNWSPNPVYYSALMHICLTGELFESVISPNMVDFIKSVDDSARRDCFSLLLKLGFVETGILDPTKTNYSVKKRVEAFFSKNPKCSGLVLMTGASFRTREVSEKVSAVISKEVRGGVLTVDINGDMGPDVIADIYDPELWKSIHEHISKREISNETPPFLLYTYPCAFDRVDDFPPSKWANVTKGDLLKIFPANNK